MVIVSAPDFDELPAVTVIVYVEALATGTEVTVNQAEVLPADTVTVGGTVAPVPVADSVTTYPPVGAAAVSTTCSLTLVPPTMLAGDITRLESVALTRIAEAWGEKLLSPGG